MSEHQQLDPLVLGRRIRHHRRRVELTLDQLGARVGKPAPYLSLVENGKNEPKVSLIVDLAAALGVDVADLLDPTPPSRRDALEISLLRAQDTSLFTTLDLPELKPSAKLDNKTLTHIVGLHQAIRERSSLQSAGSEEVRRANGEVHRLLEENAGYFEDLETVANDALATAGYSGEGPFSPRNLLDLTAETGFELTPIDDMPTFARSIIDLANRRIYIAQRNELRTRQARKAVLQTLAGFLLSHETDPDLNTFLRQRMETAYLASAILVPEQAIVPRLLVAKENHDIDVEDVKELFYVSYEMAAWRTINLATRHLRIRTHLLITDDFGTILKGYANDGVPVPRDDHGGMENQRLCRKWGARVVLDSNDRFDAHHQYTDTPEGTFFCTTHVEADRQPAHVITVGTAFDEAKWFRGRSTEHREVSTCPDPTCCRLPAEHLSSKWADKVIVSARSQARILGLMRPDPYPELDMPDVLEVVEGHAGD